MPASSGCNEFDDGGAYHARVRTVRLLKAVVNVNSLMPSLKKKKPIVCKWMILIIIMQDIAPYASYFGDKLYFITKSS